jgi:cyclic beta-1,2-glucan synthetase
MYRAGIEAILGFRREGEQLLLAPCIPAHWPGFSIDYRFGTARYSIRAVNAHAGSSPPHGRLVLARAELDGRPLPGFPVRVTLADDGARHEVLLTLEPESTAAAARG